MELYITRMQEDVIGGLLRVIQHIILQKKVIVLRLKKNCSFLLGLFHWLFVRCHHHYSIGIGELFQIVDI